MKAPSCSNAINKAWVKYVVEEHLKKQRPQPLPEVEIEDFTVSRGAMVGDAFNSELVTLDINASLTDKESSEASSTKEEYHFIVKFLSTDVFNKVFNRKFQSSLKEYIIYAEYVKDLNDFQSSRVGDECRIYIPELIYGKHSEEEFVLVMENIKYDGYENNDKYKGLGLAHLKEAVVQLARIHALSYVHNKTHPFLEKHPYFAFNESVAMLFASFASMFMDNGLALLNTKEGSGELVRKIEASKERLIGQFSTVSKEQPCVPQCLLHGDYWNNNIMYKYEEKEEPSENKLHCKVVDWGSSGWGSPVLDLQYLLHTSTNLETRKEHLETILKFYHSNFTDITTRLDKHIPNWTYDEFLQEWKRLSFYGFFVGLTLSQGTLSKSNPVNKPRSASVMDYSFCFPAKFLVDGMKQALAKAAVAFMFKPSGKKMMALLNKKMFSPIRDEVLSGSNEVMNKRILDLLYEADDNGLLEEG